MKTIGMLDAGSALWQTWSFLNIFLRVLLITVFHFPIWILSIIWRWKWHLILCPVAILTLSFRDWLLLELDSSFQGLWVFAEQSSRASSKACAGWESADPPHVHLTLWFVQQGGSHAGLCSPQLSENLANGSDSAIAMVFTLQGSHNTCQGSKRENYFSSKVNKLNTNSNLLGQVLLHI